MTDYSYGGLLGLLTAPARAMTAQPPQANFGPSGIGNWLTKAHSAIDPVQAFGGYGNMMAMALPPGGPKVPFNVAKAAQDALYQRLSEAGKKLDAFPKVGSGPLRNLTPDHIKQTPEWKAAYAEKNAAHEALRRFNERYVKEYKTEIAADRKARGR